MARERMYVVYTPTYCSYALQQACSVAEVTFKASTGKLNLRAMG
jgi:hypothetical protein